MIANLGLVFLLLLLWVFYRSFKLTGQNAGRLEPARIRLLLIGGVLWIQMFIFPTSALLCYACGFLLAAEQWHEQPGAKADNRYHRIFTTVRSGGENGFSLPQWRGPLPAGWHNFSRL
jgi:hypothetical protein